MIPALNPIRELADFVRSLLARGVRLVIVVNDGSGSSYQHIFADISRLENCMVLTHDVNRGKGRALKTAFRYVLDNHPELDGVVTADADGQHTVQDVTKLCDLLSSGGHRLILGIRDTRSAQVPRRSYLGNTVTSWLFEFIYGAPLPDTQTGLRGIPMVELPWVADLAGERYDYEFNMLITARRQNIDFTLTPISTLYFDNNNASHYRTFKDSFRIAKCLLPDLVKNRRIRPSR